MSTKFMSDTSLSELVTKIKSGFAPISHTHTVNDITNTLPILKGGTGATNKLAAMRNIIYTTIASGDSVDLNSYTSQGIRCFTSTVPATNNVPTDSTGVGMLVVDSVDIHNLCQVWIELSGSKTDMFMRTRISGTWSSWGRVYNTNDDLPAVNPTSSGIASNVTNCSIFRRAGVTYMTGYITGTPTSTTAGTVTLGVIPEEYRGTINANTILYNSSEKAQHTATIYYSTGLIRVNNVVKTTNTNQNFFFSTQWI